MFKPTPLSSYPIWSPYTRSISPTKRPTPIKRSQSVLAAPRSYMTRSPVRTAPQTVARSTSPSKERLPLYTAKPFLTRAKDDQIIYQRRAELESVTSQLNQRIMEKRYELERLNAEINHRKLERDRPLAEFDELIGDQKERLDDLLAEKKAELELVTRQLNAKNLQKEKYEDAELDALERDLGMRSTEMESRKATVLQVREAEVTRRGVDVQKREEQLAKQAESLAMKERQLSSKEAQLQQQLLAGQQELQLRKESLEAKDTALRDREQLLISKAKMQEAVDKKHKTTERRIEEKRLAVEQKERRLHTSELNLAESVRLKRNDIRTAEYVLQDKKKDTQWMATQLAAMHAEFETLDAQLKDVTEQHSHMTVALDTKIAEIRSLELLASNRREDITWMDKHLHALFTIWENFEKKAQEAEKLEALNSITKDLLADLSLGRDSLVKLRETLATEGPSHIPPPLPLPAPAPHFGSSTSLPADSPSPTAPTPVTSTFVPKPMTPATSTTFASAPSTSPVHIMPSPSYSSLRAKTPASRAGRLPPLRPSTSATVDHRHQGRTPDPIFARRRLGFYDNVLQMKLEEIQDALDTDVDYVNRDGVNATSILESYRLITIRQHELVQLHILLRQDNAQVQADKQQNEELRQKQATTEERFKAREINLSEEVDRLNEKETALAVEEEELHRRRLQLDADAQQWAIEEEKLRENLRELEITNRNLADESAFHETQLEKIQTLVDEKKSILEQVTQALLAASDNHDKVHAEMLEWQKKQQDMDGLVRLHEDRLAELQTNISRKQVQLSALTQDLDIEHAKLQEAQMQWQTTEQELAIKEKKVKMQIYGLQADVETLTSQYTARKQELQTITDLLAKKNKEQAATESILRYVNADLKTQQSELETAKRRYREQTEYNQRESEKINEALTSAKVQLEQVQEELTKVSKERDEKLDQLESARREMAEQMEQGKLQAQGKQDQTMALQQLQTRLKLAIENAEHELDGKQKELQTLKDILEVQSKQRASIEASMEALIKDSDAQAKRHDALMTDRQAEMKQLDELIIAKRRELAKTRDLVAMKQQEMDSATTAAAIRDAELDAQMKSSSRAIQQMDVELARKKMEASILEQKNQYATELNDTRRHEGEAMESYARRIGALSAPNADEAAATNRPSSRPPGLSSVPATVPRAGDTGSGVGSDNLPSEPGAPSTTFLTEPQETPTYQPPPEPVDEEELMSQLDSLENLDNSTVQPGILEEYARRMQNEVARSTEIRDKAIKELKRKTKEVVKLSNMVKTLQSHIDNRAVG